MGKLIAPGGAEIIGTYEMIPGCAGILDVTRSKDGEFEVEHDGNTEVWWNGQDTQTDGNNRIFVDETGILWIESVLTYKESEDDQA